MAITSTITLRGYKMSLKTLAILVVMTFLITVFLLSALIKWCMKPKPRPRRKKAPADDSTDEVAAAERAPQLAKVQVREAAAHQAPRRNPDASPMQARRKPDAVGGGRPVPWGVVAAFLALAAALALYRWRNRAPLPPPPYAVGQEGRWQITHNDPLFSTHVFDPKFPRHNFSVVSLSDGLKTS